MTQTAAIWFVVLAALLAANLPFMHQRLLLLGPVLRQGKNLWWHLLELICWYFLVGGLALWLEQRVGQIAPQTWEFYAVTATLFVTLAFPGFVFRYLLHHRRTADSETR
ncbi:DUF2818 family protein [Giesbergeria anulus]|uniref:DUF2818 domain-containing protein n=1 Tax=Giesbergeria anulus TaxID=180197 RepID=A0A1H9GAB4_9BURK|nr:DUF2818 family protein [Giesbergeria anulus]SEQ47061.1 Protein of unknown function [Giesbergeria anulus]